MKRIRLSDINHSLFAKAWTLYKSAFPTDERRQLASQRKLMGNSSYHFEIVTDGDKLIGFMLWWDFEKLRYVEHFAIKSRLRGQGIGQRILKDFIAESMTPVLLEVEPPTNELTRRRIGFYERAGFVLNNHPYMQPPYHIGGNPVPLMLMTYPRAITKSDAEMFCKQYHPVVYAQNLSAQFPKL